MKFVNGKRIAEKINRENFKKIIKFRKRPNLAIILVGERPDSDLYVNLKEKKAKEVGIDTHLYKCPQNISQEEVLKIINFLNKDKAIDAILIQLPLPVHLDAQKIINSIDPQKDADRFHPDNLKILSESCNHAHVMPPVFGAILEILKDIDYQIKNKQICIIANSEIFGKNLAHVLKCQGAKIKVVDSQEKNLNKKTNKADILISAVGKPKFIKEKMIKKDAIIIDIGATKNKQGYFGDVDSDSINKKAGYLTPVPGGVGPITVAMLLKNVVNLYQKTGGNKNA